LITLKKTSELRNRLVELAPFVIAFSAGKDSAFLLREALRAVDKEHISAVFIDSPLVTDFDRQRLNYYQKRFDMSIQIVRLAPLAEKAIAQNSPERCYYCKKFLFTALMDWAKAKYVNARLLDGSTASDVDAYRPGRRALAEMGVISPLQELGIRSEEIVAALKRWHVPGPYLCSSSCLATRVPYYIHLNEALLRQVEAMESFWHDLGIVDVRCRVIEDGCRVELPRRFYGQALRHSDQAVERSRQIGFKWIALDLEPVRSGPWDKKTPDK